MTRYRNHCAALFTAGAGLLFAAEAQAGWQTSADAPFGAALKGDLYTPATPGPSPGILVVIHMCTGNKGIVHGWFDSFAEANGFYLIAPDSYPNRCFDSSATRSGDRAAIVDMVNYVLKNTKADKSRVFAAGMSSGGCMTNTLLAIYPDVFAGGSAMPGFPAGGWPAGDTTCTKCSQPLPSSDGKYWGDIARKAFAFSGTYPCSQQWVGGGDEYNFNGWLPGVVAQWQNLASLGAAASAASGIPNWTRTVYKDTAGNIRLETNLGPSTQKHDLETVGQPMYKDVVRFLGLDKPTGACGLATSAAGGTGSGGGSGTAGGTGSGTAGAAGAGAGTGAGGSSGAGTTPPGTAGSSNPGTGTAGSPSTGTGTAGASPVGGAGAPGVAGSSTTSHAGSLGAAGAAPSGGETPPGDSGGCSVGVAGHSVPMPLVGLLAAGVGALFTRRRRARG